MEVTTKECDILECNEHFSSDPHFSWSCVCDHTCLAHLTTSFPDFFILDLVLVLRTCRSQLSMRLFFLFIIIISVLEENKPLSNKHDLDTKITSVPKSRHFVYFCILINNALDSGYISTKYK